MPRPRWCCCARPWDDLARVAYRLGSESALIGACEVADLCRWLEAHAEEAPDVPPAGLRARVAERLEKRGTGLRTDQDQLVRRGRGRGWYVVDIQRGVVYRITGGSLHPT